MDASTTQTQNPKSEQAAETPGLGDRIVSTPGTCGGKPRIAGHRITVKHVVIDHQRAGLSPDEIASTYPSLTLADVYAVGWPGQSPRSGHAPEPDEPAGSPLVTSPLSPQ